jgi:hypothetical protein
MSSGRKKDRTVLKIKKIFLMLAKSREIMLLNSLNVFLS